eukprot:6204554-Pleurochrysis_carterae.AAC.1
MPHVACLQSMSQGVLSGVLSMLGRKSTPGVWMPLRCCMPMQRSRRRVLKRAPRSPQVLPRHLVAAALWPCVLKRLRPDDGGALPARQEVGGHL